MYSPTHLAAMQHYLLSNASSVCVWPASPRTLALTRRLVLKLSWRATNSRTLAAAFVVVESLWRRAACRSATRTSPKRKRHRRNEISGSSWSRLGGRCGISAGVGRLSGESIERDPVAEAADIVAVWAGVGLNALLACANVFARSAFAGEVVQEATNAEANLHPPSIDQLEHQYALRSPDLALREAGGIFAKEVIARTFAYGRPVKFTRDSMDHSYRAVFAASVRRRWRRRMKAFSGFEDGDASTI